MSTQLQRQPQQPDAPAKAPNIFSLMASAYSMSATSLSDTLRKTIFPSANATNEQLAAFCVVAHQYGLNPFLKEIYAFPAKGGGVIPVVSIDGWIKIINRHPQFESMSIQEIVSEDGKPICTTCTIRRKDRTEPVSITEHLTECFRATEPWKQMPSRMLRHKAVKECARYAFGFGGIHDEDEARDVLAREAVEERPAIPTVGRRVIQAAPAPQAAPTAAAVPAAGAVAEDQNPHGQPLSFDLNEEAF